MNQPRATSDDEGTDQSIKSTEQEQQERQDQQQPERRLKKLEAYYDESKKCFLMRAAAGNWIEVSEVSLKRRLHAMGYRRKEIDSKQSEMDAELLRMTMNHPIEYSGPLAGHRAGVVDMGGQRMLVTKGPKLVKAKAGEWPTIGWLLWSQLVDPELKTQADSLLRSATPAQTSCGQAEPPTAKIDLRLDQRWLLLGWLKFSIESLMVGDLRAAQALVLAGPANCGKSFLQNQIITPLLGGRSAKPYRYMIGGTEFNSELFGAEHLIIEDEVASTDIRRRRDFGARIKEFTVNEVRSLHGKHKTALSATVFWRLTISLNDEDENLMILPPLEASLKEKLILLKVHPTEMPLPTGTVEQRQTLVRTIQSELPAFVDWLLQWQPAAELGCNRFGIRSWQHPDLVKALDNQAPESCLDELIGSELFDNTDGTGWWEGTAQQLEDWLLESAAARTAKSLLRWSSAMGTYLRRLAVKYPERYQYRKTEHQRLWRIAVEPQTSQDPN